jgi:hypothetical protein
MDAETSLTLSDISTSLKGILAVLQDLARLLGIAQDAGESPPTLDDDDADAF